VKVLVVGAAGYLGRHVWKQLEERGHEVVAVDGLFWGQPPPPGLIKAEVLGSRYAELVSEHRPESVVWLGAIAHDPEKRVPWDIAQRYTYRAPARCVGALPSVVQRFVFVSTLSVFTKGPGFDGYPRHKREAERAVFQEHKRASILRFGTLFGPGVDTDSYREHLLLNKMVYDGLKHGVVRVANPQARRPVYAVDMAARDVVEAATGDAPPGVENHFTFSRTIEEYGEEVSQMTNATLVVEPGVDSRDYGWDDGLGDSDVFGCLLWEDTGPLLEWTREHLEEIRPRRQIFERAEA